MGRPVRLIIDTDPGVDDAIALLIVLAWPQLELTGVTTVGGNVPLARSTRNALAILDYAGRLDVLRLHLCRGLQRLHPAKEKQAMSIGFNVTEPLEKEIETLKERGATFHGPIVDNPDEPIRLAFFTDPDGNPLYLCEEKPR